MTLGELNYMMGHQPWHQWTCVSKLRVIDTNQIQSKAQQPDKILNHRDLGIWLEIWLGWHKIWAKLCIWVHWNSMGSRVVHGKNDCWVFFYFCKSIVRTCYGLKVECCEEVYCYSGAWLVIQLGAGVEQTVKLLPPMVGRSWISKLLFSTSFSSKYL